MIHPAVPVTLLALAASAAAGADGGLDGVRFAQLTIRERLVVRVPMAPRAAPQPVKWKEKKGPKCLGASQLAGALVTQKRAVDLVVRGGQRYRAKLDGDCKPIDFYSGFYLRPAADGMICAGRDAIRVRSGGSCQIDTFRTLVAQR